MRRFLLLIVLFFLPLFKVQAFEATTRYEQRIIAGWKVYLSRDYQWLAKEKALALFVLEKQLNGIVKALPSRALALLREVPIWLEYEDGRDSAGIYHISPVWLANNDYNPEKLNAIEMNYNMVLWKDFQPWIVLHELTHAYHYRHVGIDHAGLIKAYENAKASGVYDNVQRTDGTRWRAYSMTDVREYFAELTEAYFGANEDEPYDRAALKKMDPAGHDLVRDLWNNEGF